MKIYILTLILACYALISQAQEDQTKNAIPAVILDGKAFISNADSILKTLRRDDVESVTVFKEKNKIEQFGIISTTGLLIIITKAKKETLENLAIKRKISSLNIASKPDLVISPNQTKPSRDSIPNGVFDFVSVEKQPEFPGGLKKFYEYLSKNIKYPKQAWKDKISGRVFLSFIVEKDGRITGVKITRGLSNEIDAEAIRVVASSPNWAPGIQFGVPVRVKYNINVNFNL